jgi:Methyltransferase domain
VCAPEQLLSHTSCVVFSVGSRGETSFERAILAEFAHCQMHTFDPTLTPKLAAKVWCLLSYWHGVHLLCFCRSVHVGLLASSTVLRSCGLTSDFFWIVKPFRFGRAQPLSRCNHDVLQVRRVPGVTFHALGIVGAKALRRAGSNFTTLTGSMAAANATWIDVLKIDIEGSEWGVFLEMLDAGAPMPFTQILIEIHTSVFKGGPTGERARHILMQFFTGMHAVGYRVFSVEPNYQTKAPCLEYAFVKVDGSGHLIRGI